jgi:hypothetical protein
MEWSTGIRNVATVILPAESAEAEASAAAAVAETPGGMAVV